MQRPWLSSSLLVAQLAGCGTVLGLSGDDDPPGTLDGRDDASAAATDGATTSEGGSSPDAECDARCLVFRDDFERVHSDVLGGWTSMIGALTLESDVGVGAGRALVATGGAGADPTFRESFLARTLPKTTGFELSVSMQATNAGPGTFGPAFLDYCEVVSLLFGNQRIMLLYRDGTTDYLWLFGPAESAGPYQSVGVAGIAGRMTVRVTWSGASLLATVARDGVHVASVDRPLAPNEADAPATVRLGVRCSGVTPDLRLVADDVEIYAPP